MAAVPPEAQPNLDHVSPILESVLGSLTQEYEKKLFDKDQDMKGLQVAAWQLPPCLWAGLL